MTMFISRKNPVKFFLLICLHSAGFLSFFPLVPAVSASSPYPWDRNYVFQRDGNSEPAKICPGSLAFPLNIYILNVGQGEAIYLELPNGRNALIDSGQSRLPTSTLAKFILEKHISQIDYAVLTHPHADHYNGLRYLFGLIPVGTLYDTKMDNTGATTDEAFREQVRASSTTVYYPEPDSELPWAPDSLSVHVLNSCPETRASALGPDINNCSIVLQITYQNHSVLFTGDAQGETELVLVAKYGAALRSEILKVAHHGSEYSSTSEFLAAVKPQKAVVSVGPNNYGHPSADTLSRLTAAGAAVSRTDIDGTQVFTLCP